MAAVTDSPLLSPSPQSPSPSPSPPANATLAWSPHLAVPAAPLPLRLYKRAELLECNPGESSCRAVNVTGCCPNDNYCYVDREGNGRCCQAGSTCNDPCSIQSYRAPEAFQCPQSLGGNCCSVGSACILGGRCSSTINPATVNTVRATPTSTICSSGQVTCAPSVGGGCCNSGWTCAAVSTNLYCVGANGASTTGRPGVLVNATAYPTGGSSGDAAGGEGGLTSGATAGIAVGATVAGLTLLSLIVWFIFARRRRRQRHKHESAGPDGGGGGGDAAAAAALADGGLESPVYSPTGQPNMSHMSSPAGGGGTASSRQDYFGPDARPGPFTQPEDEGAGAVFDAANRGAVPVNPRSPADITAPVEIGVSGGARPDQPATPAAGPTQDAMDGPVELP